MRTFKSRLSCLLFVLLGAALFASPAAAAMSAKEKEKARKS